MTNASKYLYGHYILQSDSTINNSKVWFSNRSNFITVSMGKQNIITMTLNITSISLYITVMFYMKYVSTPMNSFPF